MTRVVTHAYTGNCPFTNAKQTIQINYFEIPVIQDLTPHHKKKNFFCVSEDECPYASQPCPVYQHAPHEPQYKIL